MLAERKAFGSTAILGSRLNGLFDTVKRDPAKIGAKDLQTGNASRNIAFVDAKVMKQTEKGGTHGLNCKLLTTLVDDEIDVVREVTRVITSLSGPRVKVKSEEIVRCIKSKIGRQEFVIHARGIPDSISSQKDMRK
jgi:hypothetical protein